ncbi:hypothetical protein FZC79_18455 [Rossellomorea vietnamensis]|uniref:Uncharacterized protein n=1 Tax=Rossellomorea vietnamensis TaxID=218284 RepID=A0A5D4K8R6_9BACI|nr:hypothetical protein [Rossellomorea vietnamensis]TYR73426.1 hypothetical protein FZC79_18455 [Rossellomorea vietnamensis]
MKKVILGFVMITAALVFLLNAFLTKEHREVKNYIEEKYRFSADIKKVESYGFPSDNEYIVSPSHNMDLEFTVIPDPREDAFTDDYPKAKEAYQESQKLKKSAPEIKKLGFHSLEHEELRLSFNQRNNYFTLILQTDSPIDIASFEEKELDRFFKLQELIKKSNAKVNHVTVYDNRDLVDRNSIILNMQHLREVKTKEELLLGIKKSDSGIASFYENEKWKAEKEKVENDRFTFGSEYSESWFWFSCSVTNEKGECSNIFVSVYFSENMLTKTNEYLEEDLNSIFTLFEKTIAPNAAIEYNFLEQGSHNSVRFTKNQIANYESTEKFINKNFK